MPKTSEAQLLLILLKKIPDASKVERLLKPDNLLILWQHQGHSPDEMRDRLTSGTLPGELLLQLLKQEPDADRLLAQLPGEAINILQTKTPVPSSPDEPDTAEIPLWLAKHRSKAQITDRSHSPFGFYTIAAGITIILFTSFAPALMDVGFYDNIFPSRELACLTAVIGGIVAGIVVYPYSRSYIKGGLLGIIWSMGLFWETISYMENVNGLTFTGVIITPLIIGCIPVLVTALALFYFRKF